MTCTSSSIDSASAACGIGAASARNAVPQVEAARVAQRLHDVADVAEQLGRHLLRDRELAASGERRVGRERAQVQRHRGELVAGDVVQFARDAQALGVARAVGEQRARGEQVGVDQRQLRRARVRR